MSAGMLAATGPAKASETGPSGLPLPRFVSLKAEKVNLRIGPGRDYPVSWQYVKSGLPVEIIQEYDNWRRIRDAEGTEGWVYQSLLSGKRTAVAAPWQREAGTRIALRKRASDQAGMAAELEPGVLTHLEACDGAWCRVETGRIKGYVSQAEIWGAYPGENFDD
jgi:SH3-like domain-containing protein